MQLETQCVSLSLWNDDCVITSECVSVAVKFVLLLIVCMHMCTHVCGCLCVTSVNITVSVSVTSGSVAMSHMQ